MAAGQRAVVPSASGYPVYSRLSNPVFARNLVKRFQHEGVVARFTTDSIVPSEIKSTGSEVILRREPEAELFDYQKNQALSHSNLDTDIIRMVIDRAKYWSLKLDEVDRTQIQGVNEWVNAFKRNAAMKLDRAITREVLVQVPHEVSKFNKGRCAGRDSGAYNLGTMGNPVTITPANFAMHLAALQAVLNEQDVPPGDFFVLLPPDIKPLFYHPDSPLYSVCISGQDKSSVLLNGESWPNQVGFELIISNDVPRLWDPITEQHTFAILAGRKDAIAMVTQLSKTRESDGAPTHWGHYWQGLQVYGFKTIRPEALAVLYGTISIPQV